MATSLTETHEFHLTGIPSMTVRNNAGNIVLHPGAEGQIVVTATKRLRSILRTGTEQDLERVKINVRQNANDISVDADVDRFSLFQQVTIDLDIAVPATVARLDLKLNAGNLEVQGISGAMKAKVNAGNLDVLSGATLADGSRLVANAGNVTVRSSVAQGASVDAEVNAGNLRVYLPRATAM